MTLNLDNLDTKRVKVTWHVKGKPGDRVTRVVQIVGYSRDEDLPSILANATGEKKHLIKIKSIEALTEGAAE